METAVGLRCSVPGLTWLKGGCRDTIKRVTPVGTGSEPGTVWIIAIGILR